MPQSFVAYTIDDIIFRVIMPVAVFVINVVVAIQVRRAAIHAAANLGVQPQHQSTSAVPTIMLITTSLIYVLLSAPPAILVLIEHIRVFHMAALSFETSVTMWIYREIAYALSNLIFVYNFYVYLITGKQFRSDLYKLFSRCIPSSSCSSPPAHPPPNPNPPPHPVVAAAIVPDDAEIARPVEAETAV